MPETKPTIKELLEKITRSDWTFYKDMSGLYSVRSQSNGQRIAKDLLPADAQLISRAPALARSHEALKEALAKAIAEIREHNNEYHHMTSGDLIGEFSFALAEAEKVSQ